MGQTIEFQIRPESKPTLKTTNCIMTNVIHKFLIYLSIYFCFACFGLSFSPSSEAGVQLRHWFKSPGYGVSALAPTPYTTPCTKYTCTCGGRNDNWAGYVQVIWFSQSDIPPTLRIRYIGTVQ
jgi:hypothetical protein